MKLLFVLTSLVAVAYGEYCYNNVVAACGIPGGTDIADCDAKYGRIEDVAYDLQSYANKHITHSFQYLILSTHFGNYEKNRLGFSKMFRKFSDSTWEDGIELIKYMTKRGIAMDFLSRSERLASPKDDTYELYELQSLARSLDIQKSLAEEAHRIHHKASNDTEVMSHMENTFVHKLRDSVRDLSGHTNDLKNLLNINSKQTSLNVYLFDEYLAKLY